MTSSQFIDTLANLVYTPEGIAQASLYLKSRGIDSTQMAFPPTVSPPNPNHFVDLRDLYSLHVFTESLFLPIIEMSSVTRHESQRPILAGFDVRYLGPNPQRTRFQKFKRSPETVLFYNYQDYHSRPNLPLVITEGILDAESLRQLNLPINVLSPLTASASEGLLSALYAMSNNIWIAYDNDSAGRRAISQLHHHSEKDPAVAASLNIFFYSQKDINEALITRGPSYLKSQVESQILSHTPPKEGSLQNPALLQSLQI